MTPSTRFARLPRGRIILCCSLVAALLAGCFVREAAPPESAPTVVFVCEHGNAKSLMAADLFNREAVRHHSTLRAVARGVRPEMGVPGGVADGLVRDGFDVSGFQAAAVAAPESIAARRVVAINLEPEDLARLTGSVVRWPDIPAAGADYAAARNALEYRVSQLLFELERPAGPH
ncbi:MAG: hypothetical protein JSR73_07105 [Proteobacteria bacterium]|nr:hypothetical protein [Pseudomonadota bacterium]